MKIWDATDEQSVPRHARKLLPALALFATNLQRSVEYVGGLIALTSKTDPQRTALFGKETTDEFADLAESAAKLNVAFNYPTLEQSYPDITIPLDTSNQSVRDALKSPCESLCGDLLKTVSSVLGIRDSYRRVKQRLEIVEQFDTLCTSAKELASLFDAGTAFDSVLRDQISRINNSSLTVDRDATDFREVLAADFLIGAGLAEASIHQTRLELADDKEPIEFETAWRGLVRDSDINSEIHNAFAKLIPDDIQLVGAPTNQFSISLTDKGQHLASTMRPNSSGKNSVLSLADTAAFQCEKIIDFRINFQLKQVGNTTFITRLGTGELNDQEKAHQSANELDSRPRDRSTSIPPHRRLPLSRCAPFNRALQLLNNEVSGELDEQTAFLTIESPARIAVDSLLQFLPDALVSFVNGERRYPSPGGGFWRTACAETMTPSSANSDRLSAAEDFRSWLADYYQPDLSPDERIEFHQENQGGSVVTIYVLATEVLTASGNLSKDELAGLYSFAGVDDLRNEESSVASGFHVMHWNSLLLHSPVKNMKLGDDEFRKSKAGDIPIEFLESLASGAGLSWNDAQNYPFFRLVE
ncbi:MAG: hypothetical protein ACKVHE_21070 [Planctomycetales bacterium]